MPIITFSINKQQQKLLDVFVKEDESNNLAAKRLLLNLLEDQQQSEALGGDRPIPPDWEERLVALEQKLENTASSPPIPPDLEERLVALEKKREIDLTAVFPDWENRIFALELAIDEASKSLNQWQKRNSQALEALRDQVLALSQSSQPQETAAADELPCLSPKYREGYTFEDAGQFVREAIASNEMSNGLPKKTKKAMIEYLALKQYDCPYGASWNSRTFNQALKDWGCTWN